MFDLLERAGDALNTVPVPLPGRVMLFAGPGGVPMVRSADGVMQGFAGPQGVPGEGFKLTRKLPGAALHSGVGVQLLASCVFDLRLLVEGDVVELHAPVFLATAGIKMNVYARMDGKTWVWLFGRLRVAYAAGVSLRGVVSGSELYAVVRCASSFVGVGMGGAAPMAGEGGIEVVASGSLPMLTGSALDLAIEWAGDVLPGSAPRALPVMLRVSS